MYHLSSISRIFWGHPVYSTKIIHISNCWFFLNWTWIKYKLKLLTVVTYLITKYVYCICIYRNYVYYAIFLYIFLNLNRSLIKYLSTYHKKIFKHIYFCLWNSNHDGFLKVRISRFVIYSKDGATCSIFHIFLRCKVKQARID